MRGMCTRTYINTYNRAVTYLAYVGPHLPMAHSFGEFLEHETLVEIEPISSTRFTYLKGSSPNNIDHCLVIFCFICSFITKHPLDLPLLHWFGMNRRRTP